MRRSIIKKLVLIHIHSVSISTWTTTGPGMVKIHKLPLTGSPFHSQAPFPLPTWYHMIVWLLQLKGPMPWSSYSRYFESLFLRQHLGVDNTQVPMCYFHRTQKSAVNLTERRLRPAKKIDFWPIVQLYVLEIHIL